MGWSTSLIVLALAKEAEFLSLTFEPSSPPVLTCAPRNTLSLPCKPSERLSVEPAHESDTPGQLRQCICHNSLELMTTDAPKRNTAYDLEGFESRRGACMCTGQACATSCGAHYRPVCIRWTREPSAEHCAFQCRTHASCEAFELIEQANETWCTLERGPVVYVPAPCSNLITSLHTRVCAKAFRFDWPALDRSTNDRTTSCRWATTHRIERSAAPSKQLPAAILPAAIRLPHRRKHCPAPCPLPALQPCRWLQERRPPHRRVLRRRLLSRHPTCLSSGCPLSKPRSRPLISPSASLYQRRSSHAPPRLATRWGAHQDLQPMTPRARRFRCGRTSASRSA